MVLIELMEPRPEFMVVGDEYIWSKQEGQNLVSCNVNTEKKLNKTNNYINSVTI